MSGNQLYTHVSMRLVRCSQWTRSGSFPGPKRVRSWWGPMVLDRNVKRTADPERPLPVDINEAEETYLCVLVLGDQKLKDAVMEAYFHGGTVEQKCAALQCCKQTFYNRLERAYAELLGYMNDVAAGVPLPVRETAKREIVDTVRLF